MILPTKYISQNEALIGVGATLISNLREPMTVSGLWERVRSEPNVGNFERFVLATDLLFIMGAVIYRDGLLIRSRE
jgi:hypothetical protein